MLNEVVNVLGIGKGGLYLDGTFGGGGHTRAILEADSQAHVVGMDCDMAAVERAERVKSDYPERFTFYRKNFAAVETLNEAGFSGAIFDLGVSSFQLDTAERGFSFRKDAPLDMRMDTSCGQSAADFLESASVEELTRAVRDYGEERRWRAVVAAIIEARGSGKLQHTSSFATLIESKIGLSYRQQKIHAATKTFQGVRIAVNREIESIERCLPAVFKKLSAGGILAVISFHSLEDRPVKRLFKRLSGQPEHRNDRSLQDERVQQAQVITRKPLTPSPTEVNNNPRSRSAKLRVLRKLPFENT